MTTPPLCVELAIASLLSCSTAKNSFATGRCLRLTPLLEIKVQRGFYSPSKYRSSGIGAIIQYCKVDCATAPKPDAKRDISLEAGQYCASHSQFASLAQIKIRENLVSVSEAVLAVGALPDAYLIQSRQYESPAWFYRPGTNGPSTILELTQCSGVFLAPIVLTFA